MNLTGPMTTEWGQEPNSDEKTWAAVAHASCLVFGVIGPIIIYFMYKDKSRFVAYHALQASIFQLVMVTLIVIISIITCGFGAIFSPVIIIFEVLAAMSAHEGKWKGIPGMSGIGAGD